MKDYIRLPARDQHTFCLFTAGERKHGKKERTMIVVTKLKGERFVLNCDLIETISENPDTTITLTNGDLYIVRESMQEVIDKTIDYKRKIYQRF
ncbi:flagellar FlbD family protein [Anaerotruncus colihominis]